MWLYICGLYAYSCESIEPAQLGRTRAQTKPIKLSNCFVCVVVVYRR